eukprot:TRINITY_DN8015_c0_g1_i1.p2 TRINITY_DN8015_c0_g1~~TRINITY_DN8015_c0_g1_i1.p2  ORF type:complete len:112 (-),score=36.94 TRINITY_DN8015_c0_g1_i1:179-469(-)
MEESKAFNEYNICNLEMKSLNEILNELKLLMKEYRNFDAKNEYNIEEMKLLFDKKWGECMKKWYTWKPYDIICWIKYLQKQMHWIITGIKFGACFE